MSTPISRKYTDRGFSQTVDNTTPFVTILNNTGEGTDEDERIGHKIRLTALAVQGYFGAITGTDLSAIRIMYVWDAQPTGVLPAITDILETSDPLSHMNLDNRERFSTLLDYLYPMTTVSGTGPGAIVIKDYFDMYKYPRYTIFNSSAATIAAISTGALYQVVVTDSTVGIAVETRMRIRYMDG